MTRAHRDGKKLNTTPDNNPTMCEICSAHGPGKRWYLDASNYSEKLFRNEDRESFIRDFIVNFNENCKKIHRASLFPVVKKIARGKLKRYSKEDHTGQVVSFEDASAILRIAGRIFLTYCPCRRFLTGKDEMLCMTFSLVPEVGDRIPPYSGGKYIDAEKAIEMLEELGPKGYVHSVWTFQSPFIGALCNCKDRQCMALDISERFEFDFMIKGHEIARIETEACTGCGECVGICQFGGIVVSDGKAFVNTNCHGCGNCCHVCKNDAITLVERK